MRGFRCDRLQPVEHIRATPGQLQPPATTNASAVRRSGSCGLLAPPPECAGRAHKLVGSALFGWDGGLADRCVSALLVWVSKRPARPLAYIVRVRHCARVCARARVCACAPARRECIVVAVLIPRFLRIYSAFTRSTWPLFVRLCRANGASLIYRREITPELNNRSGHSKRMLQ